MQTILLTTKINADINRCFDLSRSIDLHKISTTKTNEIAIAGRTTGLIELGEYVTWRAKHFGITQNLTSRITKFDRPTYFQDIQERGIFKYFQHDHTFTFKTDHTIMLDIFKFESPGGFIGRIIEKYILIDYLTDFLKERNRVIKDFAETDKWKGVLELGV